MIIVSSSPGLPQKSHKSRRSPSSSEPLHHIEINVSDLRSSSEFYEGFLSWLGYKRVLEEKEIVGWRKGRARIFIVQCGWDFRSSGFHRKRVGLNHIAFRAPTRRMVDDFYHNYLLPKKVPILYGGTKEWPEYEGGYYAVYFEDPDRIKLELAYTPL